MNRPRPLLHALFAGALLLVGSACARKSAPLPGDSVTEDGAVTMSSPRLVTNATTPSATTGNVTNAREPLSPLESRLFPAELVMEHQAEIALLPAQRDAITKELDRSQTELVKLQWELQTEKDKLVKVLSDAKVDEPKSRDAAAALMLRENAIKAAHLALLVRIKNVLTAEQQEKLQALREGERCSPASATSAIKDAGHD